MSYRYFCSLKSLICLLKYLKRMFAINCKFSYCNTFAHLKKYRNIYIYFMFFLRIWWKWYLICFVDWFLANVIVCFLTTVWVTIYPEPEGFKNLMEASQILSISQQLLFKLCKIKVTVLYKHRHVLNLCFQYKCLIFIGYLFNVLMNYFLRLVYSH